MTLLNLQKIIIELKFKRKIMIKLQIQFVFHKWHSIRNANIISPLNLQT